MVAGMTVLWEVWRMMFSRERAVFRLAGWGMPGVAESGRTKSEGGQVRKGFVEEGRWVEKGLTVSHDSGFECDDPLGTRL